MRRSIGAAERRYNRDHGDRGGHPVRDDHRHRGPRPAADRVEDVLPVPDLAAGRGRGRAEHARLPDLPGDAGDAAVDQPARRRAGDAHRAGPELPRRDPRGPIRAQELLLPRSPEGIPDQPVRPAADQQRPPGRAGAGGGRRGDHRHHPRAPRGGHRADAARRARLQRGGLQPRRRAADGDRHRARAALAGPGPRLRGDAARAAARHRRLERGHGGGQHADRGQRQPSPGRLHRVRDEGRGQEPELVPLAGAGARVRGRAPRRGARARRDAAAGDPGLGRGGRADDRPALEGGGERLSLLPRARPAAVAAVRGVGRRAPCAAPRASVAAPRALHRRAGPVERTTPGSSPPTERSPTTTTRS